MRRLCLMLWRQRRCRCLAHFGDASGQSYNVNADSAAAALAAAARCTDLVFITMARCDGREGDPRRLTVGEANA